MKVEREHYKSFKRIQDISSTKGERKHQSFIKNFFLMSLNNYEKLNTSFKKWKCFLCTLGSYIKSKIFFSNNYSLIFVKYQNTLNTMTRWHKQMSVLIFLSSVKRNLCHIYLIFDQTSKMFPLHRISFSSKKNCMTF